MLCGFRIQMMMRQIRHLRFLIYAFVAFGITACKPDQHITMASLNWHPEFDQTIRQLEDDYASSQQQQPKNYISSNLGALLDAKLYFMFDRYLTSAKAGEKSSILEEQRRWLDQRKRAADRAYADYEDGTFASLAGNQAYIEATKERIAVIQQRLAQRGT